jgi:hypothetical protein
MKLRSILVLVVLLAACSGDDSSGGSSSEAPTAIDAPTTSGATTTTTTTTTAAAAAPGTTEASPGDDLSGTWEGELTQLSSTGVCPPMPTQRGTVLLEQTGATFTLVFQEGFMCDPLEACAFAGTIDGNAYSATNGGFADSEGGLYTTSFILVMDSADHGNAFGESSYTFDDMECTWETSLILIRR